MDLLNCIKSATDFDEPVVKVSGEAFGPRRFRLSAGIDPMYRGPASLEVVSESSESAAQVALQGLTCEKKTESILVKVADLYIK